MIDDCALGADSAGSWAGISAFLVVAGFVQRALRADSAFRTAERRRASEARQARANRLLIENAALAVRAAGRRHTRVRLHRRFDGPRAASDKWTSLHSRRARAHRDMVDNFTHSVRTAHTRARIYTFVASTSSVPRAVVIKDTFWPTAAVRISLIFRQTCADTIPALSVGAARRRVARVGLLENLRRRFRVAVAERISSVSLGADADGNVVYHATLGIRSA